jgi:oxalate decarboxylase
VQSPPQPPPTDAGNVPNLRFSFADAYRRVEHGGWAREVTVRELPVATSLAGVNMALEPGAVRELHWHKQAEWAYMLAGRARITALDAGGRSFADDIAEGDLWYFPAGIPHSIQGLAEGCEFLLVFDDGGFSEDATFLLTDWLAHTPPAIVARHLGLADEDLRRLPSAERYIFPASLPQGSPASERPEGQNGPVARSFSFRLHDEEAIRAPGGSVRIADSANFPVATTIAAALVDVEPGGVRELHWHPNAAEWQYYISGSGRMGVFAAEGKARTFDYVAGDVGYVPFAMGHYIENTGETTLRFLEMFRSDRFADISLNQWLALTPPALVREHLQLDAAPPGLHADKRPVFR